MRRVPALLLLAALLGGIGASSVHRAEHAAEWAEAQRTHAQDHRHDGTDQASVPCAGGDLHALDCAVCFGLSGLTAERVVVASVAPDAAVQAGAEVAYADARRAVAPARGPPAVA